MAENVSQIYREIYLPVSENLKWKVITLNTGASASTLQDIKVPESCGGYTYKDSGLDNSPLRNRFIYWKATNDVLELVEESLDLELFGSKLKVHFQDTQILGGVSIFETQGHVVVLIPTVACVHRLVFSHPNKLQRTDLGYVPTEHPVPSVFHDASLSKSFDPKSRHMLNPSGSITSHLHCAATYQTNEGEAIFALASNTGSIVLVIMPPLGIHSVTQQVELTASTGMGKWLTGLVPAMMRSGQEPTDTACSLAIHTVGGEACIFVVCRDHRLRIWSSKTFEMLLNLNLLEYIPNGSQVQSSVAMGTGHMIKKIINSNSADLKFGIHLNFSDRNQFCILEPKLSNNRLQVMHHATIHGLEDDLIDFCVTPQHMTTLWTSADGGCVIRTVSLSEGVPGPWQDVILQPPEIADLKVPQHEDPREVYLQRLFQPGRFSLQDIRKALSLQVYSKALEISGQDENSLNISALKQDVTIAVETEIRNSADDYEMQEEDYYQLQLDQWTKFYSCCIQYHEVGSKLKGVFADSGTGLVCLIRKGCITYLRPCEDIEALYCGPAGLDPSRLLQQDRQDDLHLVRDLGLVWNILHVIGVEMTEDMCQQFDQDLWICQNLDSVCQELVDILLVEADLDTDESSAGSISHYLRGINDLPEAIGVLLRTFDLSQVLDEDVNMEEDDMNTTRQLSCLKLFTSRIGSSVLSTSVHQFIQARLSALRDLLLLQEVTIRLGDRVEVDAGIVRQIQRELIPLNIRLLRAYQLMKWTSETLALPTQANTLENNLRQLATLDISESSGIVQPKSSTHRAEQGGVSLLELFVYSNGGEEARSILANIPNVETDVCFTWSSQLLSLVKTVAKLVWPISENFLFPEFLVGSCQYLALQEYVSQLNSWCEFGVASRSFLLGLSYIHFDEPLKAAECFVRAREGVSREEFLNQKLLQADDIDIRKLEVLYYLKVIKQFEETDAPDVVISLTHEALDVADDDDPNVPTLWSKVFKYELELGHNMEAYNAMIRNPDPSRRKDCLRQLLIMLCERGDLQSLVDFPYTDLEEEVETILESRARSMDLMTHNYYDLLYAFHIFRNNFRKAGRVMYEHGWRLGREVLGTAGLQRQARCYLSALNALRIVKPEYAWVVKPKPMNRSMGGEGYGRAQKHALDGDVIDSDGPKLEIVELHDIEKEFMLVDARLRLISHVPDAGHNNGVTPRPEEMVGFLVKAGMFDRAVIICRAFNLKLDHVFKTLADRCVDLAKKSSYHMQGDNNKTAEAWDWLKTNNLTLTNIAKEKSAADQAWQLLQQYLDRYEEPTARYHRCSANILLTKGFTLPTWLVNSYKSLNMSELLRLYIDYDMLEEAVALSVEYIDAVVDTFRGQDSHIFKLKGCLQHMPLTVWMPYTSIDLLLQALQDHRHDHHLGAMYQALQDKLEVYLDRLKQASYQVAQPSSQPFYRT